MKLVRVKMVYVPFVLRKHHFVVLLKITIEINPVLFLIFCKPPKIFICPTRKKNAVALNRIN